MWRVHAQVSDHRALVEEAAVNACTLLPRNAGCIESCCSRQLSCAQAEYLPTVQGATELDATAGATRVAGLNLYAMGSFRRGASDHGDIDFVMVPPTGMCSVGQPNYACVEPSLEPTEPP
jgi:hypothetical protein